MLLVPSPPSLSMASHSDSILPFCPNSCSNFFLAFSNSSSFRLNSLLTSVRSWEYFYLYSSSYILISSAILFFSSFSSTISSSACSCSRFIFADSSTNTSLSFSTSVSFPYKLSLSSLSWSLSSATSPFANFNSFNSISRSLIFFYYFSLNLRTLFSVYSLSF